MTPPPDLKSLSSTEKDALIAAPLARIDGLTVRVEQLEARVAALEAENAALEAENEALKAENAALREKLNLPPKTPDNSSTPPSQGAKPQGEQQAKPKGKAYAGAHRPLHPNPTRRRDVFVERCPHCDAAVTAMPQVPLQAYDRIEIPTITPEVTRVTLFGGVCPCCREPFKAAPPADLPLGSPYGPNLRAFVLYLRFAQAIPFERLARLLFDLFGLTVNEDSLANMLQASAPSFATQAAAIRRRLLSGTILQSDETSARVGNRTWWTWVFQHADSPCFVTAPRRGKKVVEAFLGDARPDVWVFDRLGAQRGWARQDHQVCLAHLIRDVRYAIDAGDDALAPVAMTVLKRAVRIVHRRPALADATLSTYRARLQARLGALLAATPPSTAGRKFQSLLKRLHQNPFVFLTNRAVPPTNNGSEQALRPCVVFRKFINCFRSEWAGRPLRQCPIGPRDRAARRRRHSRCCPPHA